MRRHDLLFVSPSAWRSLIETRCDLAEDSIVASWGDKGWPLVVRRATRGEEHGVAAGLPLPPFAGKRRISLVMRPSDIVAITSPPALSSVRRVAPSSWWPTLEALRQLAARHSVEARVFGSLAWSAITGLDYLTGRSDLDLLLCVHRNTDLHRLTAGIAEIQAVAPMRLDGEFMRDDGAAVNWQEFHSGARDVLVKTVGGVALFSTVNFLLGKKPS